MHPFFAKHIGPVAAEYAKKIAIYFRTEIIVLVSQIDKENSLSSEQGVIVRGPVIHKSVHEYRVVSDKISVAVKHPLADTLAKQVLNP